MMDVKSIVIDILRKSPFSDKSLGNMIRSLHMFVPYIIYYFLFFGTKKHVQLIIFLIVSIFIFFFVFNGCILSKIEHHFLKDDFTTFDPILEMIGVEVNNPNRKKYGRDNFILLILIIAAVYYYRFS